jgi:hypothetical protein
MSIFSKLFQNPPKTLILVAVFIVLLVAGLALSKCHAGELVSGPLDAPYVQLDTGVAIIRGTAPILGLTFAEPASVLPHSFWEEELTIIGASKWQNVNAPNNAILTAAFADGFGRVDIALGVSWMANPSIYNGESFNFSPQIDYRFKDVPVTVSYRHYSDAGLSAHNIGRDTIELSYRF